MKKIISLLMLVYIIIGNNMVFAETSLGVSAIVGNSNHTPRMIIDTSSSLGPNNIKSSTASELTDTNFTLTFTDDETDNVTYTITTQDWWGTVDINNWSIVNYDSNNQATINFTYFSPIIDPLVPYDNPYTLPVPTRLKTITLTLNDWANLTVLEFLAYIY